MGSKAYFASASGRLTVTATGAAAVPALPSGGLKLAGEAAAGRAASAAHP